MIIRLRSSLFSLGVMIATIIHGIISLFVFWIPFKQRHQFINLWSKFVLWWLKITCNIRYEIQGLENIPQTPCIVVAKHASTWETLALQTLFVPQVTVLKKELLKIPFFGWGLRLLEPIAIDRGKGTSAIRQLISQGKNALSLKRWIVIYPEGSRIPLGETKKFNLGAAILAEASGYPLLPIAHNAGKYWPKRQFLKKPGTIQLVIGKAIEASNHTARELNQLSEEWINQEVKRLCN